MQNPKTDFNACFPFFFEIQKKDLKAVLKSSSLACAHIIIKQKTTVQDNSFANPCSDFPMK